MLAYRIADARHPIFDPTGAMVHGGRWNSPGTRVIYAAETFAGAMLEVLVHANLSQPPKNHRVVRIEIPDHLKVETVNRRPFQTGMRKMRSPHGPAEMNGSAPKEPPCFEYRAWSHKAASTT